MKLSKEFISFMVLADKTEPTCRTNPKLFFPEEWEKGNERRMAISIAKEHCAACPIRLQCLEYAVTAKEEFGIWGGLTREERW